ncbi:hypothetical protein KUCAC02_027888 [Chaenocephalus aceratus]|nr:hypothetical protein KUCAC02_027888 [Chaenocephalus aceratus]
MEVYQELLPVQRLHDSWRAIKSYFWSLGEDTCTHSLWQLFRNHEDGDGKPLELQVYLSFLDNVLNIFHDVVLLLEREDGTVCERYDMIQQQQIDSSFGTETSAILQQFPNQKANMIFPSSTRLLSTSLRSVEVLQMRGKLDMDELYDEYCVTPAGRRGEKSCCCGEVVHLAPRHKHTTSDCCGILPLKHPHH